MGQKTQAKQLPFPRFSFLSFVLVPICSRLLLAVESAFFFFFFGLQIFAEISVFLGLHFFWGFFCAFWCFGVVDLLGFVWLATL